MSGFTAYRDDQIQPADNAVPKGRFTIVRVTASGGHVYETRIDCPKGAPGNGLSEKDIEDKLRLALPGEEKKAEELIKATRTIKYGPLFTADINKKERVDATLALFYVHFY